MVLYLPKYYLPISFMNMLKGILELVLKSNSRDNKCSTELFIKLAMTVFFKRQQHRKLSWLDKDSDKNQSQLNTCYIIETCFWFVFSTRVTAKNTTICFIGLIFSHF
jgi:hypothetical protein